MEVPAQVFEASIPARDAFGSRVSAPMNTLAIEDMALAAPFAESLRASRSMISKVDLWLFLQVLTLTLSFSPWPLPLEPLCG